KEAGWQNQSNAQTPRGNPTMTSTGPPRSTTRYPPTLPKGGAPPESQPRKSMASSGTSPSLNGGRVNAREARPLNFYDELAGVVSALRLVFMKPRAAPRRDADREAMQLRGIHKPYLR